jgi:hypothetical protein
VITSSSLRGWCPRCNCEVAIDVDLSCTWCHGRANPLDNAPAETFTPSLGRRRRRNERWISPDALILARSIYERPNRPSLRRVAELLIKHGMTPYSDADKLEDALRAEFHARGYRLRTTSEALRNRRVGGRGCCETKRNGEPCGANALADSDYCWAHDPRAEIASARLAARGTREHERFEHGELLAMQPFAQWLRQRRAELALPPSERRFPSRDEGLTRLAASTGIDQATLSRWMRGRNNNRGLKRAITRAKVVEIIERDGSTTLEAIYGAATLAVAA